MMTKLTESQISTAALWWADALSAPDRNLDNGDDSKEMGVAFCISVIAGRHKNKVVTNEQKQVFVDTLKASLGGGGNCSLSVDYEPDKTIGAAMDAAGISRENAPMKTWMLLKNGGVFVEAGYRAPRVTLLPESPA